MTIALAGKHGKAKLRGTLTVAAVNGVATFSGLTLTNARKGQALQFQVTAGGLTSVTTNPLSVLAAAARIPSSSDQEQGGDPPSVTPTDSRPPSG